MASSYLKKTDGLPVILRWTLLSLWGCTVVWLSLSSSPPAIESPLLGWDKFQHAMAYALFTLLAGWCFTTLRLDRAKAWLYAIFSALFIGGLMEVMQATLTATRSADVGDFIADAVGAMTIYIAKLLTIRYRQ
jgi:VanZ family protein